MSVAVPGRPTPARPAELDPLAGSLWISLRYLSISRLLIAGVLALLVPLSQGADADASAGGLDRPLFQAVALVYLLLSAAFLAAIEPLRPRFQLQLLVQVLVDLVALSLLIHAGGGLRSGFGVLLIAPVAGAAILSTPLRAGFFAAVAAILLLAQAAFRALADASGGNAEFVQAGLTGAACFAAALLVNRLAQRLGTQEALARRRGEDLRSQLAINQLVIADLPDGVVVMSRSGEARTMNRSARALLGPAATARAAAGPRAPGLLWSRLAAEHAAWRGAGCPPGRAVDLPLDDGPVGGAARAGAPPRRVRLRFLGPPQVDGDCVVLVEDLDRVDERAQQLKLASMGRLSASIAHEIRNPLGAIRHANGLLAERLQDAQQRRLAAIVEDNSVRINQVVEHVLSIARRERAATEPIDLGAFLPGFVEEYVVQHGVEAARIALAVESPEPLPFDREHLRQVLVNLVGNALRYATQAPGAVRIAWRSAGADRLELVVADDGPGLSNEQAQHVFEPFFTTESRGTGLGLYLVRELCGSNGAAIRYERFAPGPLHSGGFVISIQRAER